MVRNEEPELEPTTAIVPHSSWRGKQTPVPARYFDQASGAGHRRKWSLTKQSGSNLAPVVQPDLVQDAYDCQAMDRIRSVDARACISLCRPYSCHAEKRLEGQASASKTIATAPFQSGEIAMRPLTPNEDEARGMIFRPHCQHGRLQ